MSLYTSLPNRDSLGMLFKSYIRYIISNSPSSLNSRNSKTVLFLLSASSSLRPMNIEQNLTKSILALNFLRLSLIYMTLARMSQSYLNTSFQFSLMLSCVMKNKDRYFEFLSLYSERILKTWTHLFQATSSSKTFFNSLIYFSSFFVSGANPSLYWESKEAELRADKIYSANKFSV